MPFRSKKFIHSFLFFLSILFFSSCTGESSRKPSDAEPIFGKNEKTFYNSKSANQILGVSVNFDAKAARRFSISASVITKQGDISFDTVHVTDDGAYLTILGDTAIYEFNAAAPEKVVQPGFVLPPTKIDTLCFSAAGQGTTLGTTGFSEVRAYIVTGGYNLVAVGPSGNQPVFTSNGVTVHTPSITEITYLSNGIGLHVEKESPNGADPTYFASFIDAGVSSSVNWSSATTLICHLNSASPTVVSITTPGYGSFTVPAGVTSLQIELWGAGGGGGESDTVYLAGGGGGGGGYLKANLVSVTPGRSISYSIGAGGGGNAGPVTNGAISDGAAGGDTSVTDLNLTAHGGGGGLSRVPGAPGVTGGAGGTATGGDINTTGTSGEDAKSGDILPGAKGGACANGGAGGQGPIGGLAGMGVPSGNGAAPGGGGGGSVFATPADNGANGANGQITFTYRTP